MGKELKEYIISKKHHQFRRDFPEYQNLAQEYHRLGLSPKERMTRRFELLSGWKHLYCCRTRKSALCGQ